MTDAKTPKQGIERPEPPPPPRVRQTTAHDLQVASQEVASQGIVPTEEMVERRATLKRAGRTESRVILYDYRNRQLFTWQTVLFVSAMVALPKIIAWCEAHAGMWGGAMGLVASILAGLYATVRYVRISRAEAPVDPDGGGEPSAPPSGPPSGGA